LTPLFRNASLPYLDDPIFKFFIPTSRAKATLTNYEPNHFVFPLTQSEEERSKLFRPPQIYTGDFLEPFNLSMASEGVKKEVTDHFRSTYPICLLKVVCIVGSIHIQKKELMTLFGTAWLNDTIMEAYMHLLKQLNPDKLILPYFPSPNNTEHVEMEYGPIRRS